MKIALAFFGLPRCSRVTFDSIRRNLIEPLAGWGELHVFYHFMQQDHVRNSSSGEDHALSPDNYTPFLQFQGVTEPPEGILPRSPLVELAKFGDAWGDGFQSLRNLMLQLHSVHEVHQMAKACEPDAYVFARPDLLYHDAVRRSEIERAAAEPKALLVPGWQWWHGGYNDRFAICGRIAANAYAQRKYVALPYCRKMTHPLHSERLLRAIANGERLDVQPIPLRASRVRVTGAIEPEIFTRSGKKDPPGP
ncbi:MAG: hypothetical protein V4787_25225 [Pseudomonadota bacterium]